IGLSVSYIRQLRGRPRPGYGGLPFADARELGVLSLCRKSWNSLQRRKQWAAGARGDSPAHAGRRAARRRELSGVLEWRLDQPATPPGCARQYGRLGRPLAIAWRAGERESAQRDHPHTQPHGRLVLSAFRRGMEMLEMRGQTVHGKWDLLGDAPQIAHPHSLTIDDPTPVADGDGRLWLFFRIPEHTLMFYLNQAHTNGSEWGIDTEFHSSKSF